jgi:hypothetical protein
VTELFVSGSEPKAVDAAEFRCAPGMLVAFLLYFGLHMFLLTFF